MPIPAVAPAPRHGAGNVAKRPRIGQRSRLSLLRPRTNMTHRVDRRGFIKSVVGGATVASLGTFPLARAGEPRSIEAAKLTDTLTLFSGDGGNVVAARDGDGLALVDGGLAARSGELARSIERATGLSRVHTLFNT